MSKQKLHIIRSNSRLHAHLGHVVFEGLVLDCAVDLSLQLVRHSLGMSLEQWVIYYPGRIPLHWHAKNARLFLLVSLPQDLLIRWSAMEAV